ncbi:polysaccharide deacetylase family protein [Nonomuraea sp. LPB2021202275-12-8]|uniref:polysaccharide deacetylase family protein n=1 Tax=Nonomuraea sp. LPB2021202275-12-8 TaxID=3120159 RepID=UPI00300CBFCA
MPKLRIFGGIALLVCSATGCGLAAASPEHDNLVPGDPTRIEFVDPATVTGLAPRTLSEGEAAGRHVYIGYPELPNAAELNDRLRAEAQRQLRAFREATRAAGYLARPELNVDWQLTAAGDVAGVRLRTGEFRGADWGNTNRTFWYDQRSGRATDSAGLLSGQSALREVAALVRERLKERGQEVDREQVTPDRDRFDSMAFNGAGDLVVEFDDCQIGPCSLGRLAVAVPARQVEPLLSEMGRRAQQAARLAAQRVSVKRPTTAPPVGPVAASTDAGSVNCGRTKCVALTFDDGPGPYTAELLDILREADARATFFPVGGNAVARPELLRRMSAEGHLVGNHSWAHRDLSKLATSKIADSLDRTEEAVTAAIGQRPTLVRPPYGEVNLDVRNVAHEHGLSLVSWDVDTYDQRGSSARAIADRAVEQAHPGAIVLMHDVNRATVDAVPDILKRLRGKGYAFVTVPELYSGQMRAGRLYRSGDEPVRKQPLT